VVAIMDSGRIIMQQPAAALAGRDLEDLYMHHMAGRTAALRQEQAPC
ncbi:MAG: hypothetical protein GYA46_11965, partial [candidate division Zixibacteria bacterium]|nr:hypothetical protein [candidate division Zixibacteria bacterium]